MFVVRCCINASHYFVGAIPLFSPPLLFHNFSILVLADHHHHLPISKATQTSAADLAGNSFSISETIRLGGWGFPLSIIAHFNKDNKHFNNNNNHCAKTVTQLT